MEHHKQWPRAFKNIMDDIDSLPRNAYLPELNAACRLIQERQPNPYKGVTIDHDADYSPMGSTALEYRTYKIDLDGVVQIEINMSAHLTCTRAQAIQPKNIQSSKISFIDKAAA